MVSAYLLPMKTAAALFPLLALVLFVPTAVVLYRRHGVMPQRRAMSLICFLYYAITALCMTIVPLPRQTQGMCRAFAPVAHPQWTPGNTFGDIWKEAHHKVALGPLVLHNPAVSGALLNLALLMPLGAFVRYHLRRGITVALLAGFGASLFFEFTQGTALWGVYPCPYRLFDVDDLLINTAGTLVGWYATGPLLRLLPALDMPDGRAPARGTGVFGRRVVALAVDLTGAAAVTACGVLALMHDSRSGSEALPQVAAVALVVWFVALPRLTGTTPGKRLLLLRLAPLGGGGRPALWRLGVRAVLLGVVTLPLTAAFASASLVLSYDPRQRLDEAGDSGTRDVYWILVGHFPQILLSVLVVGWIAAYVFLARRRASALWFHEALSGVRTVALPDTRARVERPDGQQGREPGTATARPDAGPSEVPSRCPGPSYSAPAGVGNAPQRAGESE
ncbi:VanZ family protein [Streptomyces sp. NPDC047017]|uniref:VanZ family protein n=1 Tax=Streptomyces sp. NPDC047017 TaxID=3155024 RepID=UPI0033F78BEB